MRKNRSYFKRVGIFYRSARLTWTPVEEEERRDLRTLVHGTELQRSIGQISLFFMQRSGHYVSEESNTPAAATRGHRVIERR